MKRAFILFIVILVSLAGSLLLKARPAPVSADPGAEISVSINCLYQAVEGSISLAGSFDVTSRSFVVSSTFVSGAFSGSPVFDVSFTISGTVSPDGQNISGLFVIFFDGAFGPDRLFAASRAIGDPSNLSGVWTINQFFAIPGEGHSCSATILQSAPTYQCGVQPNGLNTCLLQKGDILLRKTPNLEIYGYWEHAGQYAGNGIVVDALPIGGVQNNNVDEEYGTADDWAVIRIPDPIKAEVAVEFAKGMVGTGYGFGNLALVLVNPSLDIRDDVIFGVYCSQLVWLGGQIAGVDLDSGTWSFNQAVTPTEIYLDNDVVLVDERPGITRSVIRVESPVDLLLVDPEGRAAGTEPATGATLDDIPGLLYSGPGVEPEYFAVENLDGAWTLQVSGVGSGPFTLVIENIERDNYHTATVTGAAFPGSLTTYLVRIPGQGTAFTEVVDIDIKPGSDPNSFNLGSRGVIPVAVLSTPTFNAATVDPFSITLEGGAVRLKGKSGNAGSLEDVDGDGDLDLVVHIMDWTLVEGSTIATLTGQTFDGIPIQGSDSVRIVP